MFVVAKVVEKYCVEDDGCEKRVGSAKYRIVELAEHK